MLIFLEDTSLLAEKVQQSKLAALGRLSASIAHEIRTPVGAMSHAGQLLAESPSIQPEDRRLTQIIRDNAERVSRIIENVLELSRRGARQPERLDLAALAQGFPGGVLRDAADRRRRSCRSSARRRMPDSSRCASIPRQLHQVIWNLCQNALTHGRGRRRGRRRSRSATAAWPAMAAPSSRSPTRGPGIRARGRGARVRAVLHRAPRAARASACSWRASWPQANGATLLHESPPGGGSLFRLVFSDPGRWEE